MNRDLLEKPFAPEQIKQRTGTYGNVLDYIEGHAVIKRLNDAFDANWSFEILRHEIRDSPVRVSSGLIPAVDRRREEKEPRWDWIDIKPEEYYQHPLEHLERLYRNFKDRFDEF